MSIENPFARKFSMTPAEEEKLKKESKTPEQIAAEKEKFAAATERAKAAEEPETVEISEKEAKEALEEAKKYEKSQG